MIEASGAIAKNICEFVLSMYPVKNAFDNIGFGANPFGIFRAALTLFISVRQATFNI
jgi:hypothetical protein